MAQQQLFADEYKVNLDVFEGPLDLLLYLIRREELDIYDIPIEHITAEYMKFINEAREMNLDIAGEFIVMAATLMVIKSRMLLPVDRRTVNEDGNEEWVDPRLDLVRQLIEYKKFKDAAIRLETMEALQSDSFDYGGGRPKFEKTAADARGALANLDLNDLLTAFQEVLARANEIPHEELKGIRFSVPEKMDYVLERARKEGQVSFVTLFREDAPKGEVIVTFLALLELLRQHRVIVYQNAAFHEINRLKGLTTMSDQVKIPLPRSLQEIVGSLLFASQDPLTATELRDAVRAVEPEEGENAEVMDVYKTCTSREIDEAIKGLGKALEVAGCGFRLVCTGGTYRLQTEPSCGRYVRAMLKLDRPSRPPRPRFP